MVLHPRRDPVGCFDQGMNPFLETQTKIDPQQTLSSVPPPSDLPSSMSNAILQKVKSKDSRRPTRTRTVRGPDYKEIVDRIQSFLVFKVSTSDPDRLSEYLEVGFPVDLKDHKGQTPLHKASSEGILESVQTLMNRGHADASVQDRILQTPLHIAVRRAAKINDDDETTYRDRDKFKAIMQELMIDWDILGYKDQFEMTALEYAKGKSWIINALTISDHWEAHTSLKLDELERPTPGAQMFASRKFETMLVDVWYNKKGGKGPNTFQIRAPSIQGLVYHGDDSAKKFISGLEKNVSCRWIHIPSNNASQPQHTMKPILTVYRNDGFMLALQTLILFPTNLFSGLIC